MCGICGIVWKDRDRPVERSLIEKMTRALAHRGPDGAGVHLAPGVGLGHRRLSVIDVEGGAQPLANETEDVWVTFNGEIYNFPALQQELLQKGHQFRTGSDTEVLVHLWEEHGPGMVAHLRGMFAFALWDARTKTLFLARDRMGQKPLVYRVDEEGIRFASELKSLVADDSFPRDLDPFALDDYLTYQYIPHPRTIYQAARKLPPAHSALYRNGTLSIERYWRPAFAHEVHRPWEEDRRLVRETLIEATRLRLISDVPIGAFLSGGVDSTIVVGIMQSLMDRPVETFSVGFPVPEYDETDYARMVSEKLGTRHHEFRVEPDAVAMADTLALTFDEPFADSSAIPTYYLSRETRRHVTVALTGDAGDELFLGYERYRAAQLSAHVDRLPRFVRQAIGASLWQSIPTPGRQKSLLRQAKRLLNALSLPPIERYRDFVTIFARDRRRSLYLPSFREGLESYRAESWIESLYDDLRERDFLTRTSYVDLNSYLPLDILTKVDLSSMAHGLECRSPMLDHHFVDLVGSLPLDRKMRGWDRKVILKEAFSDLLPGAIAGRRKMGFGVPLDHWFRKELAPMVEEVLFAPTARNREWFDSLVVRQFVQEHASGRWDHSARLWSLLMLELWARNYLDRR